MQAFLPSAESIMEIKKKIVLCGVDIFQSKIATESNHFSHGTITVKETWLGGSIFVSRKK